MTISKEKIKEFFKANKNYFLVFGILLVVFNFMLLINGAWPYGSNTLVFSDSYAQIAAFFNHIFNWFEGKTSLFYTAHLGGGMEIFSTIQYMLINPFFLIVLICGRSNILTSINFSILFMIVFNACVMLWFLNKRFKNLSSLSKILFSLLFAFTAFSNLNFSFITWLIYPALALLLIDSFLELVENKKILRFVIVLVWFVVNCFSVGVSTSIIFVVLFFGYIFFKVQKENRKEVCTRLFVAYVIGVLACVGILFPSIMAFFNTSRGEGIFSQILHQNSSLLHYTNITPLLLNLAVSVFAIIYVCKSFKENKTEFKFNIFTLLVCVLPVIFGIIPVLLSGGQLNFLPYRFYFVTELILMLMTIKYLSGFEETSEKSNFVFKIMLLIFSFIIAFVFLVFEFLLFKTFTSHIKKIDGDTAAFLMGVVLMILTIIAVAIAMVGFKFKKVSSKLFKGTAYALLCVTLAFNCVTFVGPLSVNTETDKKITEILFGKEFDGKVKIADINETTPTLNYIADGVYTNTVFSSLIANENLKAFWPLIASADDTDSSSEGFAQSDNVLKQTGDLLADALVGNKYLLTSEKQNRPYLTLEDSIAYGDEYIYLYKNTLATNGTVVLDKNFAFKSELDYFENIKNLQTSFGLSGEIYQNIQPTAENITNFKSSKISAVKKYTFTATESGIIYLNQKYSLETQNNTLDKFEEKTLYLNNPNVRVWTDVAFVEAGETITFNCVSLSQYNAVNHEPKFLFASYQKTSELCTKLKDSQASIERTKTGFEVKTNGKSGKLVVFDVCIKGLNLKLDEKQVQNLEDFSGFVCVNVETNNQILSASYSYPYIWIWIGVILVCAGIAVLVYFVHKKTGLKAIEKYIYVLWWILICCILSIFYIFCILLTFFKLII